MVRKLLKYDLLSCMRTMLPLYAILLGSAVITRIVQLFENMAMEMLSKTLAGFQPDPVNPMELYAKPVYDIFLDFAVGLQVVCSVVCLVMAVVTVLRRYYTNLCGSEGYLSHSLPVTATQHILSKTLTALIVPLSAILLVVASAALSIVGDLLVEVWNVIVYYVKGFFESSFSTYFGAHIGAVLIEIVVAVLSLLLMVWLVMLFCIAVGQRRMKRRVLWAFAVFFILYAIVQFFGIALSMFWPGIIKVLGVALYGLFHNSVIGVHCVIIVGIILIHAINAALFVYVRRTMQRRLNIE